VALTKGAFRMKSERHEKGGETGNGDLLFTMADNAGRHTLVIALR